MPIVLARPYPVAQLIEARKAIEAASSGDVSGLQDMYRVAADALNELDPDDVTECRRAHKAAIDNDASAAHTACVIAEAWEDVVSVGSLITDPRRFRGFAWLVAATRYMPQSHGSKEKLMSRYMDGASLQDTSPEDSALFVALPALIGLGPELPEELEEPAGLPSVGVAEILGLPEGNYEGIDPIDGLAIRPEDCRAHYASMEPKWRSFLSRCLQQGLLIRADTVPG
jgi:hypothetical protein